MVKTLTFEELTREAARVERALREYDDPKKSKLSAKAFVRVACREATTSSTKLNALANYLNPDNTPASLAFVTRAERMIADNTNGICTRPPQNAQRLGFLGRDGAVTELAGTIFTIMELFALAAHNAAKLHPDSGQPGSLRHRA